MIQIKVLYYTYSEVIGLWNNLILVICFYCTVPYHKISNMLSKFSAISTLDVKHWSISTLKWLQTKLNLQNKNQEDSEPGENHARGQRPPEAVVIRHCLPLVCSVRLSSWKEFSGFEDEDFSPTLLWCHGVRLLVLWIPSDFGLLWLLEL